MEHTDKENKYLKAKEHVDGLKKFYTSLMFYIIFISLLAGLNYYMNEFSYPWFLWVAFGWGIGLIFHAFKTFQWLPYMNKKWEERKIKEFMEKDDDITSGKRWK